MTCCLESDITEAKKIASQLKYVRDWKQVVPMWKATTAYRRNQIMSNKEKNLVGILDEWPLYRHSQARELVQIDFTHLNLTQKYFFTNWDIFVRHAPELFSTRIKDAEAKILLKAIISSPVRSFQPGNI